MSNVPSAKDTFANAITFTQAQNVRNDNYQTFLEDQKLKNNELIAKIPQAINENRINCPKKYMIRVGAYNEQLAQTLSESGYTVLRPNYPPDSFRWDLDDDLYIRDNELYESLKSAQKCYIL